MHGRTLILATAAIVSIAFASPAPQDAEVAAAAAPPAFPPTFRYDKDESNYKKLPKRSQLPTISGNPEGSAWLWGKEDDLGRLNLLTPKRVQRGMKESKTGEVVPLNFPFYIVGQGISASLLVEAKYQFGWVIRLAKGDEDMARPGANWPVNRAGIPFCAPIFAIDPPFFGRPKFNYSFAQFGDGSLPVFDEYIEMNSQTASQIDGFRHFGHIDTNYFYNGCTQKDIFGPDPTLRCGMQEWAKHGIVGRAIFLDVGAYRKKKQLTYPILDTHNISLPLLKEVAKSQGIDLRRNTEGGDVQVGDLLLVRTGFLKEYFKLGPAEKAAYATRPDPAGWTGLEANEDMLDFVHDSYFPGVFADNPSMEAWPLPPNGISLHESMLSFWGSTIGEFWDLEMLSKKCAKNQKWTFFVTSAPFHIDGGIASWANAIAIL